MKLPILREWKASAREKLMVKSHTKIDSTMPRISRCPSLSKCKNSCSEMDGEGRTQAHQSCDVQAPLLAIGSRVVITTTQPASLGTSNSVGALEVCLKGRIGLVAAFDEARGTVRVNVDYEVNGDV